MAEQQKLTPEQSRVGCLQMFRTFFIVTAIMPIFHFVTKGPAVNQKQLVFRISVFVIGVVGAAVVQFLLAKAQRKAGIIAGN